MMLDAASLKLCPFEKSNDDELWKSLDPTEFDNSETSDESESSDGYDSEHCATFNLTRVDPDAHIAQLKNMDSLVAVTNALYRTCSQKDLQFLLKSAYRHLKVLKIFKSESSNRTGNTRRWRPILLDYRKMFFTHGMNKKPEFYVNKLFPIRHVHHCESLIVVLDTTPAWEQVRRTGTQMATPTCDNTVCGQRCAAALITTVGIKQCRNTCTASADTPHANPWHWCTGEHDYPIILGTDVRETSALGYNYDDDTVATEIEPEERRINCANNGCPRRAVDICDQCRAPHYEMHLWLCTECDRGEFCDICVIPINHTCIPRRPPPRPPGEEESTPEGSGGKPWQEGVLEYLLSNKKATRKETEPCPLLGANYEDTICLHTL